MVLNNNKIFLFVFVFMSGLWGYDQNVSSAVPNKLPELITKAEITSTRFISQDGRYTYYQKRSGKLILSTNFEVKTVLSGKTLTEYFIHTTPKRKKMVVEKASHYYFRNSINSLNKIYTLDFGKFTPTLRGEGLSPRLHLADSWVSFYNPKSKKITFIPLDKKASLKKFKIKINNPINPFFIPEVIMLDEFQVFYTDLNIKGFAGIFEFNKKIKKGHKNKLVLKSSRPGIKIEFCQNNQNVFIGQFPLEDTPAKSTIHQVNETHFNDAKKFKLIYESSLPDTGNLICNINKNFLYFIKNYKKYEGLHLGETDVAKIDLSTKKLQRLSFLQTTSNIINLDGRLLLPYREKYFVLYGKEDAKKDTLN